MYDIKSLMVTLDMSEIDESMVAYAGMVAEKLNFNNIYFLHVVKPLDLPEDFIHQYPELDDVIHSTIETKIKNLLDDNLEMNSDSYEIIVRDGRPDKVILEMAGELEIDIIAVGLKSGLEGAGVLSHKIARLAPCNVVFVPEVLPTKMERILVPVDFSDQSKMATQFAAKISSKNDYADIIFQHVYTVPSGYSKLGKTYEEFGEIMKTNAVKMFNAFSKSQEFQEIPIDECEFTLNEHGKIHESIYMYAIKIRATVIVIGSKGRTEAASLLLGSTADKLLNYNKQLPIIVVKDKDHNLDFLEAILRI